MSKLFSNRYNPSAFNAGMLILRVGLGVLMINHGYPKLMNFESMQTKFIDFMGLGPTVSLCLVIFAEVVCAGLLVLGLFTRFAAIPLIINMSVALFKVKGGDIFGKGELDAIYIIGFLAILFCGPGRWSMDAAINK